MDFNAGNTTGQNNYDQELASALEGLPPVPVAPAPASDPATSSIPTPSPSPALPPLPEPTQAAPGLAFEETPVQSAGPVETPAGRSTGESSDLDGIKKDAISELRPLIDKVELPAEEKFDTYLMIIRSTDDATLIGPAHAAAQAITDEKRRAEALLDIIKEIDYFSHGSQPAA